MLTANDANPPVVVTLATAVAAFTAHTGHIAPSPAVEVRLRRTPGFGFLLGPRKNLAPSLRHAVPVIVLDHPERHVMELDQRSAGFLAQPVLHVRHDRIGRS